MQAFKPTVSVIISTYQRGHLVSQAINSVLAQTYKDYEVIVINDGSQDNTPQVLAQFSDRHRITAIHQANQGLSAACNAGIRSARGKYIAFLDDDDLWEPQKLEKQVPVLEANPRIGLIYSDSLFFSNKRGLFPGSYNTALPTPNLQVLWTLFRYNYIPVLTVVVRRDCLDKVGLFDETLRYCGDYDYLYLLSKFKIMHFIVTGGAGFIGSHLTEQLLSEGHRVTVVDNLTTGRLENLPKHSRLTFLQKDILICQPEDFTEKIDSVVHLAAISSVTESLCRPL